MDNIITPDYAIFYAAFIPYDYKFCFQYSFYFLCILYCESFCFVLDYFKIYSFINWVYNKKIENKKFSILRCRSLVY